VIRFGPAAAPRWFNQDLNRLRAYLELISEAGARSIEFVTLPGEGTEELGRVHLLEPIARRAIRDAQATGLVVNLHAPLTPEYRLTDSGMGESQFERGFASVLDLLQFAEAGQAVSPVLVLHAASVDPGLTADRIGWLADRLRASGSAALLSLELRAEHAAGDRRFDRSMGTLARFVRNLGQNRVGICWDVAHDWESGGVISRLTPAELAIVNHVHIHDSRADGVVHAPLGGGHVPWENAVRQLMYAGWSGSITLEIRYRYAVEQGDPWRVLEDSLRSFQAVLSGE
jgi:sugar phosphate isomerase/epimerase